MQSVISPRLPLSLPSTSRLTRGVITCIAATAFVALCAHISVPLPFTPVPVTLQNFAVVLLGMLLGPVAGFAAMSVYLAEGLAGMPVFSPHGLGGVAQLLGPTGGFLLSYPLAAAVAGAAVRFLRPRLSLFKVGLLAGFFATLPIFALGAVWLCFSLHLPLASGWHLAVAPFLVGEVLKLAAVATLFAAFNRLRQS